MYIVIPAWVLFGFLIFWIFPLGVIISFIGILWTLWTWLEQRERKAKDKRQKAIMKAVASLSSEERLQYLNYEGRYSFSGRIPRNLDQKYMTNEKRLRFLNKENEFVDQEDED